MYLPIAWTRREEDLQRKLFMRQFNCSNNDYADVA
jgi:hypothetical protein